MKTEQEIKKEFYALAVQRDCCTKGSVAREMLNQRLKALAWVMEHPDAPEILLDEDTRSFLDCVG
jgi:hypothetical protein